MNACAEIAYPLGNTVYKEEKLLKVSSFLQKI